MKGWIIAVIVLALFLFLKVGVRFRWERESAVLKIRVGLLRFALSTEKKEKKPKRKKKAPAKKQQPTAAAEKKPAKKGISPSLKSWLLALLERRHELLSLIGKVLKSPTLDLLRLQIMAGGKDAEACAMSYGKICAGLGAGLPILCNTFRVKKQDIDVSCRFDLPKTQISAEVEATIMIYEVLALIGTVLGLLVKIFITKKRNDKAVQTV